MPLVLWLICPVSVTTLRITEEAHLWGAFSERRDGPSTLNGQYYLRGWGLSLNEVQVENVSVLASFMWIQHMLESF